MKKKLRYAPRFKQGMYLVCKFGGRIDIPVLVLARQGHYGAWEYQVLACSKFDRAFRFVAPERCLRTWEGAQYAVCHT